MTDDDLPTPTQIVAHHEAVVEDNREITEGDRYQGTHLAVKKRLWDVQEYTDVYPRAAALLYRLIGQPVFYDGNKETAWRVACEYLDRHGETPVPERPTADLVLDSALQYDVQTLATWLETGEIEGALTFDKRADLTGASAASGEDSN